jgi:hypothetical protein
MNSTYTVKVGDSLSSIARDVLGDMALWTYLASITKSHRHLLYGPVINLLLMCLRLPPKRRKVIIHCYMFCWQQLQPVRTCTTTKRKRKMNLAYYNMNGLGETTQDFLTNTAAQSYSAAKSGSDSGAKVGVTIAGAVSATLAAGGPSAAAITGVLTTWALRPGCTSYWYCAWWVGIDRWCAVAGRAKAKAIKGQISEVNQQTSQYQSALNDLDNAINKTEQAKAQALGRT